MTALMEYELEHLFQEKTFPKEKNIFLKRNFFSMEWVGYYFLSFDLFFDR